MLLCLVCYQGSGRCFGRLLQVLSLASGRHVLLLYCSGNYSLHICQLSERSGSCTSLGSRSFEEFKGRLLHKYLKCYDTQQQIQQLDNAMVGGVAYVCVTCTQQLIVFEVQATASALKCNWLNRGITHTSSSKIVCSKLRFVSLYSGTPLQ